MSSVKEDEYIIPSYTTHQCNALHFTYTRIALPYIPAGVITVILYYLKIIASESLVVRNRTRKWHAKWRDLLNHRLKYILPMMITNNWRVCVCVCVCVFVYVFVLYIIELIAFLICWIDVLDAHDIRLPCLSLSLSSFTLTNWTEKHRKQREAAAEEFERNRIESIKRRNDALKGSNANVASTQTQTAKQPTQTSTSTSTSTSTQTQTQTTSASKTK